RHLQLLQRSPQPRLGVVAMERVDPVLEGAPDRAGVQLRLERDSHERRPVGDHQSPSAAMRFWSSFSVSSLSLPFCFSARMARSFSFSILLSARFFATASSASFTSMTYLTTSSAFSRRTCSGVFSVSTKLSSERSFQALFATLATALR